VSWSAGELSASARAAATIIAPIRPAHQILSVRFRLGGRIGKRKDNRTLNFTRHLTNNRFGERPTDSRKTDENRSVDLADHVGKPNLAIEGSRQFSHSLDRLRIDLLLKREIGPPAVQQAIYVDYPEAAARFVLG
jgi:hypothetical protein